jgi:hypothetical protein
MLDIKKFITEHCKLYLDINEIHNDIFIDRQFSNSYSLSKFIISAEFCKQVENTMYKIYHWMLTGLTRDKNFDFFREADEILYDEIDLDIESISSEADSSFHESFLHTFGFKPSVFMYRFIIYSQKTIIENILTDAYIAVFNERYPWYNEDPNDEWLENLYFRNQPPIIVNKIVSKQYL